MSGDEAGFSRVGIAGLGLIGGSVALAVRRAWPSAVVAGMDLDEEVVREALARGIVNRASTKVDSLDDVDLVVLAAPVGANVALLPALARRARKDTLLTDAGSTKRDILAAARWAGAERQFLGGHPLAGAAEGGLAHASASLFDGRPWLLTPDRDTPPPIVSRVEQFVRALGALPRTLEAAEHDRIMAAVSHLPQIVASVLMDVAGELAGAEGLAFAGKGLADTTRLASSPATVWRDVCAANADCLSIALRRLIDELEALRDDLPYGDRLAEVFQRARAWRRTIS